MKKKSLLALAPVVALVPVLALAGCNSNSGGGGTTGGTGSSGAGLDTSAVVASVGGESISRGDMFSFLEANAGEAALRQLLDYHLVMQEAKAKGVEVADADVEAEVKKRAESNPNIAEVQKNAGPRFDALKQQLRSQIAVERLLTKDIKADPAAVEKWLSSSDPSDPTKKAKNRARYDKPAQVKVGLLLTSQKARADVMASQLKSGKSFSDLVKEQKAAKDKAAQGSTANTSEGAPPGANSGYLPLTQLPEPVKAALAKVQVNGTTPPVVLQKPMGKTPGAFAIVQLLDRKPEQKAKATDPEVVLEYKLTQAAIKTLKASPNKITLEQAIPQIMQSAMQQAMQTGNFSQPTYRQALDQINAGAVTEMLSKLRTGGSIKVDIPDKQYESVLASYKPLVEPGASGTPGMPGAAGAPAASGAPAAGGAPAANGAPAAGASNAAGATR